MSAPRPVTLQRAVRAAEILQVLDDVDARLRTAEISDRAGIPLGTVSKDLRRLEKAGLVEEISPKRQNEWVITPRAPDEITTEVVIKNV